MTGACEGCRRSLATAAAYQLYGPDGPGLRCVACALVYRPLLRRSLGIALAVGSVLLAINQGDVLLAGRWPPALAWKIPLTYLVPFVVATWGALLNSRVSGSSRGGSSPVVLLADLALVGCLSAPPSCPAGMAPVRAGDFLMGSDAAERVLARSLASEAVRQSGWFAAELARQTVRLPAFCLDRFLVTQTQYATFVAATGHRPPGISKADYVRQGFLVHDDDREVTPTSGGQPGRRQAGRITPSSW